MNGFFSCLIFSPPYNFYDYNEVTSLLTLPLILAKELPAVAEAEGQAKPTNSLISLFDIYSSSSQMEQPSE